MVACHVPEASHELISKVAGEDVDGNALRGEGVPWNCRLRRSISRARSREVLIHVFSGGQRWRGPGRTVEIDKAKGSDFLSEQVWQHVLVWAMSGVVGGVVGGPPCRTVTRCRSETFAWVVRK